MKTTKRFAGLVVTSSESFGATITCDTTTGLIVDVKKGIGVTADYVFDERHLLFAGFVDPHVHLREYPMHDGVLWDEKQHAALTAMVRL